MLNHPTLGQLQTLKLDGMAQAFAELEPQDGTADLSHAEWLGLLIDRETASRETKRFESRMRSARLRHVGASPEDVDYRARRGLDKALFQELLTGTWIADKRNLILTGRVASITGQARSTLTRENGQPTDSNLAQPSSVILLRARTPICASVF